MKAVRHIGEPFESLELLAKEHQHYDSRANTLSSMRKLINRLSKDAKPFL